MESEYYTIPIQMAVQLLLIYFNKRKQLNCHLKSEIWKYIYGSLSERKSKTKKIQEKEEVWNLIFGLVWFFWLGLFGHLYRLKKFSKLVCVNKSDVVTEW